MQHFYTVLVVARNLQREILMIQRNSRRHDDPGVWNCVTGYVADRESVEDAALRELKEETNLSGKIQRVAGPRIETVGDKTWIGMLVLIDVEDISGIIVDAAEAQDHRWVLPTDEFINNSPWLPETLKQLALIS